MAPSISRFLVAPGGSVFEPQIVRGVVDAVDAEALRAISTLKKWKPGRHKGSPVFTKHLLPLEFRLKGWSFWTNRQLVIYRKPISPKILAF